MNDFDFFTGTWDVANRWRTDFLDPGSQWEEFPGVSHASRHFGGNANFDEITFPTKGFSGLTLNQSRSGATTRRTVGAPCSCRWPAPTPANTTRLTSEGMLLFAARCN